MTKYMAILTGCKHEQFDRELKREMKHPLWSLDDKPPETPYAKLSIKVKKKERRYLGSDLSRERTITIGGLAIVFRLKAKRRGEDG